MTNLEQSKDLKRYDFIDALRGWAFISVLIMHASLKVGGLPLCVKKVAEQGQFGVLLFYVVSAFTLFLSFNARSKVDRYPVTNFFIRRFFRIAPMFWLAIFFYVWWNGMGPRSAAPNGIGIFHILITFAFLHGWYPTTINSVVPGGWSIAIEMNFYILLPILFKYITNVKRAIALSFTSLVGGRILLYIYNHILAPHYPTEQTYLIGAFTYYWLPSQLVIFSLGILLFFFLRDQLSGRYSTQEKLMHGEMGYREAVFLIMIFLYLSVAAAFPYNLLIPAFFIYGLAFLALGWSLAIRPLPIFVNFLTTYAGKVSYSAYLVHFFVVDVCSRNLAPYSIYFHPTVYFLIFLAISFLGTIAISTCTFLAIEQPGQALGKKIIKIINGKNLRGFSLETHGSTW